MIAVRQVRTYCRICEAACGLVATVEGDRVVALRPDREHPVSRGFACAKGTRFHQTSTHPSRLWTPQLRGSDGTYTSVTWDRAYAEVAARIRPILRAYGPHAVAIYFGNPLAFHAMGAAAMLGLQRALGSRNVYTAGSQDCNNKFAAGQIVHGSAVLQPLPDFERCQLAVLVGTNPAVSQSSFVHLEGGNTVFDRLKARGASVVVVDPRRTESVARWADQHLAPRPGTDVFWLLALLDFFRDRAPRRDRFSAGLDRLLALAAEYPIARAAALCGVPAASLNELAGRIAAADGVAFHASVGLNQGPFGTLGYIALQALAYVTGNFDRYGGSLFHPLAVAAARWVHNDGVFAGAARSRVGGFPAILGSLPGGILADEILRDGRERVRALINVAGDPLRSIPGSARLRAAFEQLDCLVHVDLFPGATGDLAHVRLPATSWLERWDAATTTAMFQQAPLIQTAGPVVPPPGDCRSDARILAELSLAIGRPLAGRLLTRALLRLSEDDFATRVVKLMGRALGMVGKAPVAEGLPAPVPKPGTYLGRGPRTPGHTLRFWHADLEGEPERLAGYAATLEADAAADLPLLLLGRRRRLGHNSWLHGGVRDGDPEAYAWLHPQDAATLNLADGAVIAIRTAAGELKLRLKRDAQVTPGTVVVPHGIDAANVNVVIPSGVSAIEPLSGMHLMTGIAVRVGAA